MAVVAIKIVHIVPKHIWIAMSAWGSRLFCNGMNFLIIPVIVSLLGMQAYEIFVLSNNLLGWYLLLDIGIGASLQNFISEKRVKQQEYESYILSAGMILMVILLLGLTCVYFVTPDIASIWLKKYMFLSFDQKNLLFFSVSIISITNALGNVMLKIWYGEQKGYISNILPALGTLLSAIVLLGVFYYKISIGITGVLCIWIFPTAMLSSSFLFLRMCKSYQRIGFLLRKDHVGTLLKRAMPFGLFAAAAAATTQIDYFIMSQYIVDTGISVYNISNKVYLLFFFAYTAVLMAVWPVFTEELNRGNWKRVILIAKKYLLIGILLVLLGGGFSLLYMPKLVQIFFVGHSIIVQHLFIVLLGVYYLIRVWTDLFAMVLQSISDMKVFSIAVPIQAVISMVSQYLLVESYQIYGIVMGLIFSYLCTTFWCLPYQAYRRYKTRRCNYVD